MQSIVTNRQKEQADFASKIEESRKFSLDLLRFGYETMALSSGSLITATGRTFTRLGNKASTALLNLRKSNRFATQLAVAEIFNQQFNLEVAQQRIQQAWDGVRASAETHVSRAGEVRLTHLQRDFVVSTEYMSREVEIALQERIEMDWDAANSIANGTFIGPQPENIHSLVNEFANAEISRDELTSEILLDRGILFSQELNAPAFSSEKLASIRNEFDCAGRSAQVSPVLVFREASLGGHHASARPAPQVTNQLCPVTPQA